MSQFLEKLGKIIDLIPDDRILKLLKNINIYGRDYYNTYKSLPPIKLKEWMKKVRYALKYLPSTAAVPVILNADKE